METQGETACRPDCSVIVPVKNEAGNIARIVSSIPTLGQVTEVIIVCGESRDGTWDVLQEELGCYDGPHRIFALKQAGTSKWDAVRNGFDAATGETLVILDGDLTVAAHELTRFYQQMAPGVFLNGSRMVFPMEPGAMRRLNHAGNTFFALVCSIIVRSWLTDSLCGTKMLARRDWLAMAKTFPELLQRDPFGDHALLYGAARLGLSIREVPVSYLARTYGTTNISRFSDGWKLFKLAVWEFVQTRFRT